MLHEFLTAHKPELIQRCRAKVAKRLLPKATVAELQWGIPLFLDQLISTLRIEQTADPLASRKISGPAGGGKPVLSEMGEAAARHGRELLQNGYSVDQLVHDYGDACQAIMDLAFEHHGAIEVDEFRTLNRCLDNSIADAVTEFAYQRDLLFTGREVQANERLGFLAHELRNLINTATLAVSALKTGNVGLAGATGAVLDRSLVGLRNLIDRSLADVRVTAGMPPRHEPLNVADFIAEVRMSAALEAQTRGCTFTSTRVDTSLWVAADRDMLFSAVGNLLQNAFKFTEPGTDVTLNAYAAADRIRIEVADHCGGLPPGDAQKMFASFTQAGADKSGLGLGLAISRRCVEANEGILGVRDVPGTGCVFSIDLPRQEIPPPREYSIH